VAGDRDVLSLPDALRPWRRLLGLFPEDLGLALGQVLLRLSVLLEGLPDRRVAETGEPDGYEGVVRRGPYHRLLMSEWLLHDAVPEEFERRAVSAEHLFLGMAYEEGAAGRSTVALFDAGSDQLGAPRIVHLAALVLLADRAEQSGASFNWGILQQPEASLRSGLTESTILDLLRGRCRPLVSEADACRWYKAVGPAAGSSAPADLWLVGGQKLLRTVLGIGSEHAAHMLCVEEPFVPSLEATRVSVRLFSSSTAGPALELEVPSGPVAARLLRDPFHVQTARREVHHVRSTPRGNVLFSVDGRSLYVRGGQNTLITVRVPNSPKEPAMAPAVFVAPEGQIVVAVGQRRAKKRTLVLTQGEESPFLHVLTKRGAGAYLSFPLSLAPDLELPLADSTEPLRRLCAYGGEPGPGRACFVDSQERLLCVDARQVSLLDAVQEPVLAVRHAPSAIFIVTRTSATRCQLRCQRLSRTGGAGFEQLLETLPCPEPTAVVLVGSSAHGRLWAFPLDGVSWLVRDHHGERRIRLREGDEVVGLVERGCASIEANLAVVDPTRTRIELAFGTSYETLATSPAPIAHAAASDTGCDIAYTTTTGELVVYSTSRGAVVLRTAWEAGP
jgi:hypothetical protein